MKKVLVLILILFFAAGVLFSQQSQEVPDPNFGIGLNIGYSIFAPIGVSAEIFLPGNIGIGGMLNGLFFGVGGEMIYTIEPGAFVRLYLGEIDGTMFVTAGVSYFTGGASGIDDGLELLDAGLLKFRVGGGYNAILGRKNQTRLLLELGGRYERVVVEGEDYAESPFSYLPYFGISLGRVF